MDKLLRLTLRDEQKIWVNPDAIAYMREKGPMTEITLANRQLEFTVKHTAESIVRSLGGDRAPTETP